MKKKTPKAKSAKPSPYVTAWSKRTQRGRQHRLIEVTDPDEIKAIKRGDLTDPIGGLYDGKWLAERSTLDAYRKQFAPTPAGNP